MNKRRKKSIVIIMFIVTTVCLSVSYADNFYAVTFGDQLISIDSSTGAGTLIGNLDSDMAAFGLADYGNNLYTFDQFNDKVSRIDPATGHTLETIDIGVSTGGEGGITFRSDGKGYLGRCSNEIGALWQFDITIPNSTEINMNMIPSMDGLDFDGSDVLFGLSQLTSNLYTIDQVTGITSLVGRTGITASSLGGLTFASNGSLYAIINDSLYTLNKNTGAASLIGDTGFDQISGLTAMVPEPCTIALLALGGLSIRRKK